MPHHGSRFRNILTRGLALVAMLCIYGFSLIGTSALLLGASSTPAQARGGGFGGGFGRGGGFGGFRGGGFRGGGFRGGGFRGAGIGLGLGLGLGLAAPYGYYGGYGYPYGYGYGDPYGYAGYYGDGGCYLVRRRVWTPYGWRIRRMQVC
jgi:hypothetical protein